uniref:Choline/carnitine acyltransferase domain-containing protein n=1 Tax=Ditylenchus dipsaci TaxID=166011 RepID=A0A915ERC3_9BILA
MSSSKSKIVSPIPLDVEYYPNWFTQLRWDLSNSLFNWFYPVKPWIFGATLAGSFACYNHASISSFPLKYVFNQDVPEKEIIRLLKVSGLSLLTAYLPIFLIRNLVLKLFIFRYKGFLREDAKNPSFITKVWAAYTIDRYLESIECILSEEEYLELLCKVYSTFTDNYVTGFWEKYAYLYGRKPLLVNSSVAHVDLFKDVPANQAVRAAHIVYLEALHMLGIVRQRIKPLGDGLVYSGHYKRLKMYSTCRIPGEKVDHLKVYKTSKHVAVYLRGHIYTVDAFDEHNKLYSKDPSQLDTFMRNMLAGDIRWADKSLNYILSKNGRAGGTTEHSIGDGAEFDHVMENFVATDLNFMTYPEKVEDIDQCLDYQEMEHEIEASREVLADAFVQMAIQLANYKQQGKFVLTYESASARFFANSRTETLRTVSKQSCAFVKSMLNEECSKAERLELLQEACKSHHLRKQRTPNVTNRTDEDKYPERTWLGASFGPVCAQGLWRVLQIWWQSLNCIYISSLKSATTTDADDFRILLSESLDEMADLLKKY